MYRERVVVTGGAGFIGRHVVAVLLERGFDVTVIDNLSAMPGEPPVADRHLRFIEADICDVSIEDLLVGADAVIHLAALVSVPESIRYPEAAYRNNVIATREVLRGACAAGVTRLVYASSAAVYGDLRTLPLREEGPCQPTSPYGEHKLQNEIDMQACSTASMRCIGLRLFNVYGVGQPPQNPYSGVITRFVDDALHDRRLTLYGDGRQSRDFIYVSDVARCFVAAVEQEIAPGIYNIGSGKAIDLFGLVSILEQVCDRPLYYVHRAARSSDIYHSQADISRFKLHFGNPELLPLTTGLRWVWESLQRDEGGADQGLDGDVVRVLPSQRSLK